MNSRDGWIFPSGGGWHMPMSPEAIEQVKIEREARNWQLISLLSAEDESFNLIFKGLLGSELINYDMELQDFEPMSIQQMIDAIIARREA